MSIVGWSYAGYCNNLKIQKYFSNWEIPNGVYALLLAIPLVAASSVAFTINWTLPTGYAQIPTSADVGLQSRPNFASAIPIVKFS